MSHASFRTILTLSLLAFIGFSAQTAQANPLTDVSGIQSGDVIRGTTLSAVYYYGADGFRYVFPNEKTYFSWYPDFQAVKHLSDADLARIPLGGNVTYKPGAKMLKINSDPTVYTVSKNGTLRAIQSEQIAAALYGPTWNQHIDDLPDYFFGNYQLGSRIEESTQYSVAAEKTETPSVHEDKSLLPALVIEVTDTGYSLPTVHIPSGRAIRFVNTGLNAHTVTEWDNVWGSGTLKPGESFSKHFVQKGRWTYYSTMDPKDRVGGSITVE